MRYDFVIIGSGFGGSVSALRLTEKGYKVLVLEKGPRFTPSDFPKTNWQLRKWLWAPSLGCKGLFKISLFRHVTVFSGVGVGGGSLVYANTLPVPKDAFFEAESWARFADWKSELTPHYAEALRMLGATPNPLMHRGDEALRQVAREIGAEERFGPTDVAVFFGEPGVTVPDPYFGGRGPERTGCMHCGACMLGCRHGAKNTLDKNYLWLAELGGAEVVPAATVHDVSPLDGASGKTGYRIGWKNTFAPKQKHTVEARGVIFAGGVLGSVPLLLKLKTTNLPRLSERVGRAVRTNSESLLAAVSFEKNIELSTGVAISSILHTDAHSHLEVVRYNSGSGFFRLAMAPASMGRGPLGRIAGMVKDYFTDPTGNWRGLTVDDLARRSQILLFMRTLDGTLRFRRGRFGLTTDLESGDPPTPFIPEAHELARRFAKQVGGKVFALATETVMGIPSTAHILGGACIGDSPDNGVVAPDQTVFGYNNMWVCDGSAVSANPGVNPSLTICAQTERAMKFIPPA